MFDHNTAINDNLMTKFLCQYLLPAIISLLFFKNPNEVFLTFFWSIWSLVKFEKLLNFIIQRARITPEPSALFRTKIFSAEQRRFNPKIALIVSPINENIRKWWKSNKKTKSRGMCLQITSQCSEIVLFKMYFHKIASKHKKMVSKFDRSGMKNAGAHEAAFLLLRL